MNKAATKPLLDKLRRQQRDITRLQAPILDTLHRQRQSVSRKIAKINGKRDMVQWEFEEGETWWASSDAWRLESKLKTRQWELERQAFASLSLSDQMLKLGWREANCSTKGD